MHISLGKLSSILVVAATLSFLTSSSNALATDIAQNGYFSVPGSYVPQSNTYGGSAQIFQPSTATDTTHPINFLNPASLAGAGYNPNFLVSPFLYGSLVPFASNRTYVGSYGSSLTGTPYGGAYGAPFVALPFGSSFSSPFGRLPYGGSAGLPLIGGGGFNGGWSGGGWNGNSWGGGFSPNYSMYGGGYSGYSPLNYGAGFGFDGMGNPASMNGFGAHQGTVPNRIVQTGPSPASGNYYQPATADPSASGGYYASGSTASAPAPQKTKSQPKSYWGSGDSDNWGAGGNPFPKDLNSVPWSK
jgi:hypothetical protein